uniref:Uncharacterized protein n=1 Tax=Arundo donax TaxID=35708 RepID=A0A0A9AIN8_ARUDO
MQPWPIFWFQTAKAQSLPISQVPVWGIICFRFKIFKEKIFFCKT